MARCRPSALGRVVTPQHSEAMTLDQFYQVLQVFSRTPLPLLLESNSPRGGIPMAKRAAKGGKPAHGSEGRKPMVVQIRGSAEYKAWAERLARFDGLSLSALYDRAARKYAMEIGFKDEAPPR